MQTDRQTGTSLVPEVDLFSVYNAVDINTYRAPHVDDQPFARMDLLQMRSALLYAHCVASNY